MAHVDDQPEPAMATAAAAAAAAAPQDNPQLPPPFAFMKIIWDRSYVREACERSKAALHEAAGMESAATGGCELARLLLHGSNGIIRSLFLVDASERESVSFLTGTVPGDDREWGIKDIMLDVGDESCTAAQRMEYLRDSAMSLTRSSSSSSSSSGGGGGGGSGSGLALHLLYLNRLTAEEATAWLEALIVPAKDRSSPSPSSSASPASTQGSSLLIRETPALKVRDLLPALMSLCEKQPGMKHLSLQVCAMEDSAESVELLSRLESLSSLHVLGDVVTPGFVARLAELHRSTSPLAASLHQLTLHGLLMSHGPKRRSFRGFLHHWAELKELTLVDGLAMKTEYLMDCLEELALVSPPPPPHPRLHRLTLGRLSYDAGDFDAASTFVPAVLKALSRSRIPFLELKGLDYIDPAIEAEMERNRRLFASGSTTAGSDESQRPDDVTAPAVPLERPEPSTAIRSHTGGAAGHSKAAAATLLSTMHSVIVRKSDKMIRALLTRGRCTNPAAQVIDA